MGIFALWFGLWRSTDCSGCPQPIKRRGINVRLWLGYSADAGCHTRDRWLATRQNWTLPSASDEWGTDGRVRYGDHCRPISNGKYAWWA